MTGFVRHGCDVGKAFLIARFPVAAGFLGLLQNKLVFSFNLCTVRFDAIHHVGHLLVGQVEPIADELRRPVRREIVHDVVERNACPGNGQASTGSDDRGMGFKSRRGSGYPPEWPTLFGVRIAQLVCG